MAELLRVDGLTAGYGEAVVIDDVSLSLDDALAACAPALPPLRPGEHGYLLTSLPETALPALQTAGLIAHVRQRYRRYFIDLSAGEPAWRAGLSANARAQIKRKAKKLGAYTIDRYRTPAEIAAFHTTARAVSAKTYQERLLDSGLPADSTDLLRLVGALENASEHPIGQASPPAPASDSRCGCSTSRHSARPRASGSPEPVRASSESRRVGGVRSTLKVWP